MSRLLWHSRAGELLKLTISLPQGGVVRFHTAAMAANLWLDPHRYDDATAFLRCYLREADTFVDVGANIGIHSLIAAAIVGPSGRVLSIEPHPQTYERLRTNVALNGYNQISMFNVAAGSGPGKASMTSLKNDDQNTLLGGTRGVAIRVTDLNSILPEGQIDLLKIDVDGYETNVLRGARRVLSETECIVFEAIDGFPQRYGGTLDDLWRELHEQDFAVYRWTLSGSLDRVKKPEPGMREDLIATRDAQEVMHRTRPDIDELQ